LSSSATRIRVPGARFPARPRARNAELPRDGRDRDAGE
jgi:hypothetical protein